MKFKEFFKKNIKIIIIIFISIVLVTLGTYLIIRFPFKSEPTNEEKLTKYLEEMGSDFYEEFYNKLGGDEEAKKEMLKEYSAIGIKVDLENLGVYDNKKNEEKIKEFVNHDTNTECDKNKTFVSIYPTSPYGVKNYDIKVTLECGFKE